MGSGVLDLGISGSTVFPSVPSAWPGRAVWVLGWPHRGILSGPPAPPATSRPQEAPSDSCQARDPGASDTPEGVHFYNHRTQD